MVDVEWVPEAIAHMWERHGVTSEEAMEAINDPHALLRSPDPASRSGRSDRYVGWSRARQEVLVVIVVRSGGRLYGGNAWTANNGYLKLYEEGRDDERTDPG
ncbi:hypothetical protein [Brevibacterium salitolerans]|uniref:DUF4258 domain-containing protein n=1 Tax=Brevibacterium salitolerans TaxID=1403566 RepID=A0ABN2WXY7_9MICO